MFKAAEKDEEEEAKDKEVMEKLADKIAAEKERLKDTEVRINLLRAIPLLIQRSQAKNCL